MLHCDCLKGIENFQPRKCSGWKSCTKWRHLIFSAVSGENLELLDIAILTACDRFSIVGGKEGERRERQNERVEEKGRQDRKY